MTWNINRFIWQSFLGFSHKAFKVGHSILEEHTASIVMVTDLAEVDADVVGSRPDCWLCRQVETDLTNQSCGRWQRVCGS
jgi:hypothetical protein